tara:strand:- start:2248 stop:2655 length:408 start_codon:yes stop_codon:yes gene_type:complete
MLEILNNNYINIYLDKYKLFHIIKKTDHIPDNKELDIMKDKLNYLYDVIKKKDIQIIQIFHFEIDKISEMLEYSECIKYMTNFFTSNQSFFIKHLKCTYILINNSFIKNIIKTILNFYTSTKPIHFIETIDDIEN